MDVPLKTTRAKEIIEHLKLLIDIFGIPEEIVSDRGTAFTSHEFDEFTGSFKIKHRLIAVAAPWANGLVERVNRFLKSSLKKLVDEQDQWKTCLSTAQYVINNTVHSSTKSTPSKLLLGYDQRNHTDRDITRYIEKLRGIDCDIAKQREKERDIAVEAVRKIQEYSKHYYDSHHKKPTQYKPGDYVLIRDSQTKIGESRKLKPNYKGPYVVTKALNKNRYVIGDISGFNITAKLYNSILSPDRMKPWVKPLSPD